MKIGTEGEKKKREKESGRERQRETERGRRRENEREKEFERKIERDREIWVDKWTIRCIDCLISNFPHPTPLYSPPFSPSPFPIMPKNSICNYISTQFSLGSLFVFWFSLFWMFTDDVRDSLDDEIHILHLQFIFI